MRDTAGDPIDVDYDISYGEVYLECTEEAEQSHTVMELTPKKARKLAKKLFQAANKAEGKCPKDALDPNEIVEGGTRQQWDDLAKESNFIKFNKDLQDAARDMKHYTVTTNNNNTCPCMNVLGSSNPTKDNL